MSFINSYGLINAQSFEIESENTFLFTGEYILLLEEAGLPYEELLGKWCAAVDLCLVKKGLYRQQPTKFNTNQDMISHDTLTSIVALSHHFGLKYHEPIWDYVIRRFGTYNNLTAKTDFSRMLHPRDILYYGLCSGNLVCKLLYPILLLIMIIGGLQSYKVRNGIKIVKTDGRLLSFLRCKASGLKYTFKILTWLVNINSYYGSWRNVFAIYFANPDHPIRKITDNYDISS